MGRRNLVSCPKMELRNLPERRGASRVGNLRRRRLDVSGNSPAELDPDGCPPALKPIDKCFARKD